MTFVPGQPAAMAGCLGVLVAGSTVNAAEVVLMTTGAVQEIMKGLIPGFEQASGNKVTVDNDYVVVDL